MADNDTGNWTTILCVSSNLVNLVPTLILRGRSCLLSKKADSRRISTRPDATCPLGTVPVHSAGPAVHTVRPVFAPTPHTQQIHRCLLEAIPTALPAACMSCSSCCCCITHTSLCWASPSQRRWQFSRRNHLLHSAPPRWYTPALRPSLGFHTPNFYLTSLAPTNSLKPRSQRPHPANSSANPSDPPFCNLLTTGDAHHRSLFSYLTSRTPLSLVFLVNPQSRSAQSWTLLPLYLCSLGGHIQTCSFK